MLRLRPFLPFALRLALGGLFLYAGVQKALDLSDAVLAVHGYDLAPSVLVHPVALGLTLLEITLGTLLILGLSTRFAAGAVAVLALLFLVVQVQAKVRGLDISCGCFGGDGTGEGVSWLDLCARAADPGGRALPRLAGPRSLRARSAPLACASVGEGTEGRRALVLVFFIVLVSLVVPGLTGALDLPQAAAPDQVSVSGPGRSVPLPAGGTVPDFSAPVLFGGTVSCATRGFPPSSCSGLPGAPSAARSFPCWLR